MKYRPKQCPRCRYNREDGAWCSMASYRNEKFKGESKQKCYAFSPKEVIK